MATLVTLCGTILGFVGALTGVLVFDLGFLAAFAIWALSGPVSAMIAMTLRSADDSPQASAGTAHPLDAAQAEAA